MAKVQFFYDYECPFCKKGYRFLTEVIGDYPDIEIEYRPVESHPRPEEHLPHSDLCIQSYYIAKELGLDTPDFHNALFTAVATDRRAVDDVDVLADTLSGIIDPSLLKEKLTSGEYEPHVAENNHLAYEEEGVWFVPAFRFENLKLDAAGGIGVTKEQITAFFDSLS